ncbi:hypothetical protein [uncultured Salinisphaera sp.]|uniref:hypothetical protein n=1 Tax=uncultured Salinisphaera sp. TaxID=359372 RepID=UPI0032B0F446|tara:strand:+ start:287 stop:634 length:348 start_codon:yes stop_codon:yes gene_type:complete
MVDTFRKHALIVCVLVVAVVLSGPLMAAERTAGMDAPYSYDKRTPSAAAMAFDVVVVRPLSLVATAGGMGLFMLSLPFSVLGDNVNESGDRLVGEPGRYTFTRPLGEFEQAYNTD